MKIHVFKYTSGLSQIKIEEGSRSRLLLDGATGRAWQGHTTELSQVVNALQGWDKMKIAGLVTGIDPGEAISQAGTWYGEV
nr:hypothetical protein EVB34_022 [Rhizobium phage RHph_TM26]